MKIFKKSYWKIPFIDKYLILSDGYPKKSFTNHIDFIDFLKKTEEKYKEGMWTENISLLINEIKFAYEQEKIKKLQKGE